MPGDAQAAPDALRRVSHGASTALPALELQAHGAAVDGIARRIRHFHEQKQPFRVYHGSTNSTRASARRADNTVDTSKLTHVLAVDPSRKTALVEPNVGMDALVEATLRHRLMPLVVMEFPAITVGGGFSGSSGESSSFRYGPFDSIINWIEIVLPDGTVARPSKTEQSDLFWGAASGFGTLGVVTLLEVQLMDAKDHVELTYTPCPSIAEASKDIERRMADPSIDFLDGIVYSPSSSVVCSGRLVDDVPPKASIRRLLRRNDPWFYIHVERLIRRSMGPFVDFIPIRDYLFRYDRGGFWVARYAFQYFFTPFNRVTRAVLDRFLSARVMYHALHKSHLADNYIIQDVGVPFGGAEELHKWLDANLKTYPLWLCPLRVRRDLPDSGHGLHADFADASGPEHLLNFGIWRPGSLDYREFVRQNRALEEEVKGLKGRKWLYAHTYYTEEEFWACYDRASYDALRTKYSATHLPSVYDKVKSDLDGSAQPKKPFGGIRPLQGLYGVWKALRGGDYLLAKTADSTAKPN